MGATTNEASRRSVTRRLDRAGQRVNGIVARLRAASDEVKQRMGRRVDSLRAHEAEFRTRLRELREANRTAGIAELDRALDQLETEIDIAEAQLNAELATDDEAFGVAVATELEAWDAQTDTLQARAAASRQGTRQQAETAIELVRERRADAGHKLAQFRAAGSEASATMKAGIRQAINDLAWATEEAASEFRHSEEVAMSTPAAPSSQTAKITSDTKLARLFGLQGEAWMRHANPVSVWTRFAVLPLLAVSIWSRDWIGWWCLVPVALSLIFMVVNPLLFPKPASTRNWASKAVFGERIWAGRNTVELPAQFKASRVANVTYAFQLVGMAVLAWGLVELDALATGAGLVIVQCAKAWYLDRMVLLFEDMKTRNPEYAAWEY